jgi:hypothetical protein
MKIAIGINIFGENKRQTFCIDVLKKLKDKFNNKISLYNITFKNESNKDSSFIHLPFLKQTAEDIIEGSISKKPTTKQFFDILSQQNCDYFIFLNSDILISPKFIDLILKQDYETYCVSRHDTLPIESIDKIVPYRIEIAGFDVWAIKTDWWKQNNQHFKDYVYAEHLWDVDYTLTMYNNSSCLLCNKEFYAAHEKHELNWNEQSLEARYNSSLWEKTCYTSNWKEFIYENLVKRLPYGQFLEPLYNEIELEKKYLKIK